MSDRYTHFYEMGSLIPVGGSGNYFSSGSGHYTVDYAGSDGTFRTTIEEKREWYCHYCGGTVDSAKSKCPNCAGEKREEKIQFRSSATITYVEDSKNEPFTEIGELPDIGKNNIWNILYAVFGRDK